MGINLLIAVTDGDWFEMLRRQPDLSEVNFWAPSAANFRALQVGELFLFKLHAPRTRACGEQYIVRGKGNRDSGSSPRVRGKGADDCDFPVGHGSSPRVRGTDIKWELFTVVPKGGASK